MQTHTFTSGRVRAVNYDPSCQQLDIHWDSKAVMAYKHVPQEVFRRLCSAPNAAAYWEDRIAEEYPKGTPMTSGKAPAGEKKLSDLFGGATESNDWNSPSGLGGRRWTFQSTLSRYSPEPALTLSRYSFQSGPNTEPGSLPHSVCWRTSLHLSSGSMV